MFGKHHIKQLYFRNVGPFREPVKIPLKQLNLFFGPNSAGKSTVERGIEAIKNFCAPGRNGPDGHRWQRLDVLKPIWTKKDGRSESYTNSMSLGITLQTTKDDSNSSAQLSNVKDLADAISSSLKIFSKTGEPPQYLEILQTESFSLNFVFHMYMDLMVSATPIESYSRADNGNEGHFVVLRDFEIEFNEQWLVRFDSVEGTLKLNSDSEIFRKILSSSPILSDSEIQESIDELKSNDGTIEFGDEYCFIGLDHEGRLDAIESRFDARDEDDFLGLMKDKMLRVFVDHVVHPLYVEVKRNVAYATRFSSVSGSRTIPKNEDLAIYVRFSDYDTQELDGLGFIQEFVRNSTYMGDGSYLDLIAGDFINPDFLPKQNSITERLNKALLEHFFNESGYFVAAKVFSICSEPEKRIIAHLVRLHLSDASGLVLNMKDVGSGVGYLLPVIVGLTHFENSFIHQPELHLHPALQGGIADTAIAAFNDHEEILSSPKQIVLETHSEHLILRFLKRIRQTAAGRQDELSLRAEDLNVLYFDPRIDKGSRVLKLRVSETGEFLDPWPQGFFEERDKDIFDE